MYAILSRASASPYRPAAHLPAPAPLPAWPLLTLLWGFPLIWVLGLMQFAPTTLSAVMVCLMVSRQRIMVYGALWLWAALVVWALVATVSLSWGTDFIAWGLRWVNIINVGIYCLYYYNARENISPEDVIRGLSFLWFFIVFLGWCAIFFPTFVLTTPMSLVLPGALTSNELVAAYVRPPLAEVQQPWGAPEPFNRPSAPFPYTNSWGLAYALLFPVLCAQWSISKSRLFKVGLLLAIPLSVVPALETSNRGMFIGIIVSAVVALVRLIMMGHQKAAFAGVLIAVFASLLFVFSGALATILGRQEYSDSTGGRAALYAATWAETLKSPWVGYGTPRMEVSIGVSMGTQGYIWMLMFCFGLVGLGIFLAYLLTAIISNFAVSGFVTLWLWTIPVAACAMVIFYSFDTVQLMILMLSTALLTRARVTGEVL